MTNYRRNYRGSYFFFTVNTFKRQAFLCDDNARLILRAAFKQVQARYPYEVLAFCLLPDHLHCIWRLPEEDKDYSRRWSLIKRHFSKAYISNCGEELLQYRSRQMKSELGIWQRRFWEHSIRNERDLENHVNYIHYNPVKHGYVEKPKDWKYSTYNRYQEQGLYKEVDWDFIAKMQIND